MNFTIEDIPKAETFTLLFKDIKNITNDINLMFEKERLYVQSMDSSHVMLFEIVLPCMWFSTYSIETALTIGIDTNVLSKILSTREKGQIIRVSYNTETSDQLSIEFNSNVKGESHKYFDAPLVDINSDLLSIPETNYNIELVMESNKFAKLIGELSSFGDSVEIECNEDALEFISKNESINMKATVPTNDLESISMDEGTVVKLGFSTKYLQIICKYNKLSKCIGLNINENLPMKIIYYLTDEEHDESMVFYLAPKMMEDE